MEDAGRGSGLQIPIFTPGAQERRTAHSTMQTDRAGMPSDSEAWSVGATPLLSTNFNGHTGYDSHFYGNPNSDSFLQNTDASMSDTTGRYSSNQHFVQANTYLDKWGQTTAPQASHDMRGNPSTWASQWPDQSCHSWTHQSAFEGVPSAHDCYQPWKDSSDEHPAH